MKQCARCGETVDCSKMIGDLCMDCLNEDDYLFDLPEGIDTLIGGQA